MTTATRIGIAFLSAVLLLALVTVTPGMSASAATPAAGPPSQAEELRGASGLTTAERAQVDGEIQRVLARSEGGVRTAVNEVTWAEDGVTVTVPMPGQMQTASACKYYYACLYAGRYFNGWTITFVRCGFRTLSKYGFDNVTSSWVNNQTSGTWSYLYEDNGADVDHLTSLRAYGNESFPLNSWKNDVADYIHVC